MKEAGAGHIKKELEGGRRCFLARGKREEG
jgi:hypothetical protein